jgi:putative addiction module CopG family antidote
MPSKNALNVSLTEELCEFVASQVASGRYRTASEVVRASLRLLEQQSAGEKAASEPQSALHSQPARSPRPHAHRTATSGRSA